MNSNKPPKCVICGVLIPLGRLLALPRTDTCLRHSTAVPVTIVDVEIDSPDNHDIRRMVSQPSGEI